MTKQDILNVKEKIISQFGPWTSHDIDLGHGISTLSDKTSAASSNISGYLRLLQHFGWKPQPNLRLLDIACLEGIYAIEFARLGLSTVGIEGRKANVQKAIFAKEAIGLGNCMFHLDDVRNLCLEKYGTFDIVIASGILYHLESPDVFLFLENISRMLHGIVIIDTHIALEQVGNNPQRLGPLESVNYRNQLYQGRFFQEHHGSDSQVIKEGRLWASISNDKSFWLTRASLLNALLNSGLKSVSQYWWGWQSASENCDRVTLVATN